MKIALIATLIPLAACTANATPPAVETRIVTKTVEIQRPCPVQIPARPAPLARPLPTDSVALAAMLADKLIEYAGPGMYADKAESALRTCTKP